MAREFCIPCKPHTRKTCASCPKIKQQPKIESSMKFADHGDRIKFMGEIWTRLPAEAEEHF